MNESIVRFLSKPKLREPVLIEGLPGMGYVGKLAAEHLVVELAAKKFAELYSPYFPHHVYVEKGGVVRPVRNEFYWASPSGKDIIILMGDAQAISPEGHYEVTKKILDLAKQFGVKQLFTMGGYATGRYPRGKPKVIGVASDLELMEICREHGAVVEEGDGPIVGASGLLLALGKLWGMRGICLLCETHGMVVDHRAAQSVLEVLTKILGIEVNLSELEFRARETERLISRMRKDMELKARREKRRMEEEAWYIG